VIVDSLLIGDWWSLIGSVNRKSQIINQQFNQQSKII